MENRKPIEWEYMVSLSQAAKLFDRDRSTLIRNIYNGVFTEGIDCKKFNTTWIIDIRRLREIYGDEKKEG